MLRVDHAGGLRRRKTKDPCPGCALRRALCICAQMPVLDLRTRVSLVVHAKELKRTTNTGRLAARALINSEVIVRGRGPVDLASHVLPGYRPLLLFPAENSVELTPERLRSGGLGCVDAPVQLIVPDGNWRQAAKVAIRHPEVAHIPRVMLSAPNSAENHLRREHSAFGMSTLEAIARALRVLEGEEAFVALYAFYLAKLGATLNGRGAASLVEGDEAQNRMK